MKIEDHHIRMLASNGDHRLGGKDWDDIIVNLGGGGIRQGAWRKSAARFAKLPGSLQPRAHGEDPAFQPHSGRPIVHSYAGKSVKLDTHARRIREPLPAPTRKCKTICEIVMQEAGLGVGQIDRILLTGGMTRMPSVREMIAALSHVPWPTT